MAGALTLSDLAERFALDGAQAAALEAYVDLLSGWERANVTGLRSRERIVETLLGDSLAMLDVPQVRKRAGAGWHAASAAGRRPLWAVGGGVAACPHQSTTLLGARHARWQGANTRVWPAAPRPCPTPSPGPPSAAWRHNGRCRGRARRHQGAGHPRPGQQRVRASGFCGWDGGIGRGWGGAGVGWLVRRARHRPCRLRCPTAPPQIAAHCP